MYNYVAFGMHAKVGAGCGVGGSQIKLLGVIVPAKFTQEGELN